MVSSTLMLLGAATFVAAGELTKPPQHPNLDYLNPGLVNTHHAPPFHRADWGRDWIPQDVKTMTTNAKLNPLDMTCTNVWYDDCKDQWIMCRHNNAQISWKSMIDNFGKLPARTRSYVRHLAAFPDKGGHAYNWNGNIAMFGGIEAFTVYVHEAAHSLDLLQAYPDKPLSSSHKWLSEYAQDSAVPDPYAQSNQVENVAQNTVVASFDLNVKGGYCGIERGCRNLFHQYATVLTEARESGNGNLIQPGGRCIKRLANSPPVHKGGKKRDEKREDMKSIPNVDLSDDVEIIEPKEFHTRDACAEGIFKRSLAEMAELERREALALADPEAFQYIPDVALSEDVEVIDVVNEFHTS